MRRLRALSDSASRKLFFLLVSAAFLIAAPLLPDRASMGTGFLRILTSTWKVYTNSFAVGGYSATFLNMGLVGLICTALYLRTQADGVSVLAFLLTVGFGSWGIHILNILPTMLGAALYALIKREKVSANAMLFSTGIAPLISELLLRYPGEAVGFTWTGCLLALTVGLAIGFLIPGGLAYSPRVHKGFSLYSASLPVGMLAFFLQAVLYKTMGVALPDVPDTLGAASRLTVSLFCGSLFGVFILLSLLMGCKPKDYWNFLKGETEYGNSVFFMNAGIYGLFILGYYNLVGAGFNGVTFGIVFCMLACCDKGSHPGNVWPILLGYAAASFLAKGLSGLAGGVFAGALNSQAIVVGLCYAGGLSPIVRKYGWHWGAFGAMMHYFLVTSVPMLHGGYCLYNGGFTACLVCLLLVPQLEQFHKVHKTPLQSEKRQAIIVDNQGNERKEEEL